jgi:hypothetical protein
MTLHDVWNDSVWSKVIGGVITAVILGSSRILEWPKRFWVPRLRKTHTHASEQIGAMYPLKYYLEVVNDSRKCVEVRVSEFVGDAVNLQKFVQSTLQILFDGKWFPTDLATEAVGLLPNQRCRAWVGVDAKKFTKADLERLEGKIGILMLTANGHKIPFRL